MQDFGLNLLIRQETIARGDAEASEIRSAMMASGKYEPHMVYPDAFKDPNVEEADLTNPDVLFQDNVEYDYSGVEALDPADFESDFARLEELMKADHMLVVEDDEEWKV